jgi:hypothetical protein
MESGSPDQCVVPHASLQLGCRGEYVLPAKHNIGLAWSGPWQLTSPVFAENMGLQFYPTHKTVRKFSTITVFQDIIRLGISNFSKSLVLF